MFHNHISNITAFYFEGVAAISRKNYIVFSTVLALGWSLYFCVSFKRRYKRGHSLRAFQYIFHSTTQEFIDGCCADPNGVESVLDLANDYEETHCHTGGCV